MSTRASDCRAELEWPEKAWKRFEREIYPFIEGRPNPDDLLKVPLLRIDAVAANATLTPVRPCASALARSKRKRGEGIPRAVSSAWSS